VGAKFSPVRTILLVSEVGRRQRKADFAFNSAVSIAFIGAPSMAWDSMRLPPQSRIAIATTCLFCSAQAVQASAKARAPALEMTLISRVGDAARDGCCATKGTHTALVNVRSKQAVCFMQASILEETHEHGGSD